MGESVAMLSVVMCMAVLMVVMTGVTVVMVIVAVSVRRMTVKPSPVRLNRGANGTAELEARALGRELVAQPIQPWLDVALAACGDRVERCHAGQLA